MTKKYIGIIASSAIAIALVGGISAYAFTNGNGIGEEKAKEVAYKDSGFQAEEVQGLHVETDEDDGKKVYEVEFEKDGYEYKYEIAAKDGAVIEKEMERVEPDDVDDDQDDTDDGNDTDDANGTDDVDDADEKAAAEMEAAVSEEQAKQIVLERVPGATAEQIRMEKELEQGVLKYEGEVNYNGVEYDFEIDANAGTVLQWKTEKKDDADQ